MKINQTNKPLLTISLLASRKDTIRKCLDSLSSLRERVPSELIIVDTSQDEEMGRILSEYTDQVIPFTWCNDFSKARNIGLDKAKGEWFLYLDDDEWFINTSEIEEFFLSGKYKKYTLAYYFQRNFTDRTGTSFYDAHVSRIFRLGGGTRFVATIHEYPDPLIGESILLANSIVEHYGYVYDTEEERRRHTQRNVPPLLEMLKTDRKNPRWWLQIIQEYRSIQKYDEVQKWCEDALEEFKSRTDADACLAIGTFYNALLSRHLKFFEYEEAEKLLRKALSDKRNTQMSRAAIAYHASILYFHNEDYDACGKYGRQFLEIYDIMKDDLEGRYAQGYYYVSDAFGKGRVEQVLCMLMSCGLRRGDMKPLKKYFWKLDWDSPKMFLEETLVSDIIDAFGKYPCATALEEEERVKIAAALMGRHGIDNLTVHYLQEKEARQPIADQCGEIGAFLFLERIFARVESEQPYILYLKAVAAEDGQALGKLFEKSGFFKWKQAADYASFHAAGKRCARLEVLLYQCGREYAAYRDYFMMKEAEVRLLRNNKKEYGSLRRDIGDYSRKSRSFLGRYFKDSAFTGEMEMLPAQGRAAALLGEALTAEDNGDVKAVSAALKSAVGVYPPFDEAIKSYTHLYAAEMKGRLAREAAQDAAREMPTRNAESAEGSVGATGSDADGGTGSISGADGAAGGVGGNVGSAQDAGGTGNTASVGTEGSAAISEEMRQLGAQVKSRIRILVNQNMLAEAKQALGQLKALLPGDTELEELEAEIRRRLS